MNSRSELKRTPGNISSLVRKVASLKLLMNCVLKKEKSICGERSTTRRYEKCLNANSQTKTCVRREVHWYSVFLFCVSFMTVVFRFATKQNIKFYIRPRKKNTCHCLFWGAFLSFCQLVNLHIVSCESETSEFLQVHLELVQPAHKLATQIGVVTKIESCCALVRDGFRAATFQRNRAWRTSEKEDKVVLFTSHWLPGESTKHSPIIQ